MMIVGLFAAIIPQLVPKPCRFSHLICDSE